MKEHIRESAKVISEEEIWHLDVLLEHLQNISKNRNLTQPKILAACLSSIIAFTNLRLSELYEASFLMISSAEAKLTTMIWKGAQGRVQISLRKLHNNRCCPIYWINRWKLESKDNQDFNENPWETFTKSQCSVHIRQLLKDAGIKGQIRVTQIRAAALTKLLQSGATKEETDRWSRHSNSSDTVRKYYDKTNNDNARILLSSFK
ncbi:MAG: hypothetical protein EZS28_024971 [Streblomastix strix]|uniref:Tyr recombinase domain-containing protein n=1 Tax=Streblomastix strix TaxID=222440 RepID=A0A5J4VAW4_9EUKA|nr:MAG: hypothetical protein EZS28_024971 [Streblomastix strix]